MSPYSHYFRGHLIYGSGFRDSQEPPTQSILQIKGIMEKKMETIELCRDCIDEVILGTMEKRMETTKMVLGQFIFWVSHIWTRFAQQ